MYSFLRGIPQEEEEGIVGIDVSGVGYRVFIPARTQPEILSKKTALLWTHTVVRQNAIDIFGFTTKIDRAMFLSLLKVPSIGPKKAVAILNGASGEDLSRAILEKNVQDIVSYGVSKQQAEKIVLELTKSLPVGEKDAPSDIVDLLRSLGYSRNEALDGARGVKDKTGALSEQLQEAVRYLHKKT